MLDHWWQTLSPPADDRARTFMERLIEQGTVFFRLADTLMQAPAATEAKGALECWNSLAQEMQKSLSGFSPDHNDLQRD